MTDYKPYRILQPFVTVVRDSDDILACYPHGKRGARMVATGTVGIVFSEGVIDAPTEEEIALFSLPSLSKSVKPIPQDKRGFDLRSSGVARSIKGSQRGREAGIVEKFERDSAKPKPAKKPAPKVEAKPGIVPGPVPKLEPEIKAELFIKDLEYLSPMAKESLAEKNVLHIADLAEWTVKALDELRGIGVKLAERLLANHEAYLEAVEPVIDETKEEGDTNE